MKCQKKTNKDGSFEVSVEISVPEFQKARQENLKKLLKSVSVAGFRKGKAPSRLAEKQIDPQILEQKTLEELIRISYAEAIKEYSLKPIISPKIELIKADTKTGWQIKFTSSELPEINFGDYKEQIRATNSKGGIWVPGKEKTKTDRESEKVERDKKIQTAINVILNTSKLILPQVIIDQELASKLSGLVTELQKLGLTIDQYLASQQKTVDQLKKEYAEEIRANWKLELALNKIAEEEKISVSEEEIKTALTNYQKTGQDLPPGSEYFLARLLRKQKTLEFLANL